ncbi:hypothetical protein ALP57_200194 [Pseudomonas coronafaciens pv. oryzae]|nr:hypothetical protein ALP56_200145 [Pseudomonas coronafaciens pv. oryzae]RMS98568.1 hypothetical protein ALP57_200194 [Pseudomonas coronafaciens pv. oryzae]
MHQLFFVAVEHAEHRRTSAFEQLPETAVNRVFVTLDPAPVLQHSKKLRNLIRLGQPLIDCFSIQTAVVGMHMLTERALALEHGYNFLLEIERLNDLAGAHAQLVQAITIGDTSIKLVALLTYRHQLEDALRRFAGMPGTGVIDGDVQSEVIRIDPQLVQLERGNQQMQRQLFIAQIVANDFRKVLITQLAQRKLDGRLQVRFIRQRGASVAIEIGQQFAIQRHVVLRLLTIPQLFQVRANQAVKPVVRPVWQQPVQPGPIH